MTLLKEVFQKLKKIERQGNTTMKKMKKDATTQKKKTPKTDGSENEIDEKTNELYNIKYHP